jgi:hypothetical protein
MTAGHGRRAHRAIKVVDAPGWIGFAAARQVAQIRRTITRGGKTTAEVVYVISSAAHTTAPPATLAASRTSPPDYDITPADPTGPSTGSLPHERDFAGTL